MIILKPPSDSSCVWITRGSAAFPLVFSDLALFHHTTCIFNLLWDIVDELSTPKEGEALFFPAGGFSRSLGPVKICF